MNVSFNDVENKFKQVLDGELSREAANDWAYNLMQKRESEELIFLPENDRKRIWDGIKYLYGIDLLENPGEYLLSKEDILDALDDIKKRGK